MGCQSNGRNDDSCYADVANHEPPTSTQVSQMNDSLASTSPLSYRRPTSSTPILLRPHAIPKTILVSPLTHSNMGRKGLQWEEPSVKNTNQSLEAVTIDVSPAKSEQGSRSSSPVFVSPLWQNFGILVPDEPSECVKHTRAGQNGIVEPNKVHGVSGKQTGSDTSGSSSSGNLTKIAAGLSGCGIGDNETEKTVVRNEQTGNFSLFSSDEDDFLQALEATESQMKLEDKGVAASQPMPPNREVQGSTPQFQFTRTSQRPKREVKMTEKMQEYRYGSNSGAINKRRLNLSFDEQPKRQCSSTDADDSSLTGSSAITPCFPGIKCVCGHTLIQSVNDLTFGLNAPKSVLLRSYNSSSSSPPPPYCQCQGKSCLTGAFVPETTSKAWRRKDTGGSWLNAHWCDEDKICTKDVVCASCARDVAVAVVISSTSLFQKNQVWLLPLSTLSCPKSFSLKRSL